MYNVIKLKKWLGCGYFARSQIVANLHTRKDKAMKKNGWACVLAAGILGLVFALGLVAGAEIEGSSPSWATIVILATSIAAIITAVEIRAAATRRRHHIEARLLGRVLAVVGLTVFVAGCGTVYDPRPARVYMPPQGQVAGQQPAAVVRQEGFPPSYLREIVAGKSVTISAPDEFRGVAIDYFRAAGAVVVESYRAHFALETRARSEYIRSNGLLRDSIRVNGSSLFGDYQVAIVEVELKTTDTRQLVFRGYGNAAYDQYGSWQRAVALAGRRALLNLH